MADTIKLDIPKSSAERVARTSALQILQWFKDGSFNNEQAVEALINWRDCTHPSDTPIADSSEGRIECPNCHNANEFGDYEGPTCQVCGGAGSISTCPDCGIDSPCDEQCPNHDTADSSEAGRGVQGSIADGGQYNEQSGKQPSPAWPQNLHPRTLDMVQRFAVALAKKLRLAEEKYGFGDGWADDHWEKECLAHFHSHIEKGDPLDVAAYCAFMWHHRWITYPTAVAETDADAQRDDGLVSGGDT